MGAELPAGYECPVCGQHHAPLTLSFSAKAPAAVAGVRGDELERRLVISADQCVLDERRFFLRGRIVIPVHELVEPFVWGVWAEVSAKSFFLTNQRWTTKGREADAAFAGYLDTEIPWFGNTLSLRVDVRTQPVGRRPHFVVADPAHRLSQEQREGMTLDRVKEIAAAVLHRKR